MKFIPLTLALTLLIAGCSTPRHPATVTRLPPAPPIAANPLLPLGFVPGTHPTIAIMSRAEPDTEQPPSLATITFLPGYLGLMWQPSVDAEVTHYAIYYGPASRQYTNETILAIGTNTVVSGLNVGADYFFAVTAFDDFGMESDYSEELETTVPQYLSLTFEQGAAIESSTNLFDWAPRSAALKGNLVWIVEQDTNKPVEFFRAATYASPPFP